MQYRRKEHPYKPRQESLKAVSAPATRSYAAAAAKKQSCALD